MIAPESVYPKPTKGISILFKIISRRSWDELVGWNKALPGSRIEHLAHGLYVLHVEPGGARELSA